MTTVQDTPKLDRFERMDAVYEAEGFFPTSPHELTEALGLIAFEQNTGGAAKHLGEVASQQKTAGVKNPLRAARRITRDYINYVEDAQHAGHALTVLRGELEDVNPELILERVIDVSQIGLLEFLRFRNLRKLKEARNLQKVEYDPLKVQYTPDNGGIMYYAGLALEEWRVRDARRDLPDAISDQAARMIFFTNALGKVIQYYPSLRPIAQEGLDRLYKINQKQ